MRRLTIFGVVVGLLSLAATAGASREAARVGILFAQSSCLQLPHLGKGQVRFFVQLQNSGDSSGPFRSDIHLGWSSRGAGWKNSWLNAIGGEQLRVDAHSQKLYYTELAANPSKPIIACGLRIGNSKAVHTIRVLH